MKVHVAMCAVLWLAISIELAWRQAVPQGCVLIPLVCGFLCWARNSVVVLVTGLALLLDWIVRPTQWPLTPLLLPVIAVQLLSTGCVHDRSLTDRRSVIPQPLELPVLTLSGLVCFAFSTIPFGGGEQWDVLAQTLLIELKSSCLIAVPISAAGTLLIRFADEFGLRRSFEVPG